MELQSVTAKVDALREKGFSDSEINQLLDVPASNGSEDTNTTMSPELLMEQIKKGNTQILRQFSKGKDPEIFNAKIDEIVEFMEKSVKKQIEKTVSTIAIGFLICLCCVAYALTFDGHIYAMFIMFSTILCLITLGFFNTSSVLKERYTFLKPRLLYFIQQ